MEVAMLPVNDEAEAFHRRRGSCGTWARKDSSAALSSADSAAAAVQVRTRRKRRVKVAIFLVRARVAAAEEGEGGFPARSR